MGAGPMVGCPTFELVRFSFTERPLAQVSRSGLLGLVPGLVVGSAVWCWGRLLCRFGQGRSKCIVGIMYYIGGNWSWAMACAWILCSIIVRWNSL